MIFTDIFAQTVKSLDEWVALPSVVTVGFPLGKVLAFRWYCSLLLVGVLSKFVLTDFVFLIFVDVMMFVERLLFVVGAFECYSCNIFKPNPRVCRRVFPHRCPCGGPDILFEIVDDIYQF